MRSANSSGPPGSWTEINLHMPQQPGVREHRGGFTL
jgi:hypothetical protein